MTKLLIALLALSHEVGSVANDYHCLSTAIYHEARGEEVMGQIAVAYVVINRKNSNSYPNTICGVVYQDYQFTDIQYAKPNYNSEEWANAIEYSFMAINGYVENPIGEARHYYNPKKVRASWDNGEPSKTIGNHKFLTGVI